MTPDSGEAPREGVPSRRVHRYGDRGVLIDLDEDESVYGMSDYLQSAGGDLITRTVEGERSLFASIRSGRLIADAYDLIDSIPTQRTSVAADLDPLQVPTVYVGEDLARVAEATGMSVSAFIDWHTRCTWRVTFEGFSAGFSYLQTGSPFQVPRRDEPRSNVAKGSVAMANQYCGIYPRAHPSGWQIIGRTSLDVWNADSVPPTMVPPGRSLRFTSSREQVVIPEVRAAEIAETTDRNERGLEIVKCLPGATIQDLGRAGKTEFNVSRSGAFDRFSLAEANRILGNPPGSAGIEAAQGGFTCKARGDQVICVVGGSGEVAVTSGNAVWNMARGEAIALNDGEILEIGSLTHGARTYIAVRGGVAEKVSLGSRSYDSLSRIGPSPLSPHDIVPVGLAERNQVVAEKLQPHEVRQPGVIRVRPGPRLSSVGANAFTDLVDSTWTVDAASSRTAIRLDGAPVRRERAAELPSEALIPGAIQLPPSAIPIIFGVDHPITGGYPIIAVVVDCDLDLLGQLAPGDELVIKAVNDPPEEN